jgi:hypothetical protein
VRNSRDLGPGGAGYFGWPAAARAQTGRAVMALRGRLIARALIGALGRPRVLDPVGAARYSKAH